MSANVYKNNPSGAEPSGGDSAGLESKAPAGRREKTRGPQRQMLRANIVLAGLFIAGGATVYGLAFRDRTATASAEQQAVESQVEAAILQLTGPKASDAPDAPGSVTQGLLETFYAQVTERQIPPEALRKNPFYFVHPTGRTIEVSVGANGSAPPKVVAQPGVLTEKTVLEELKTLALQSVMMGRNGTGTAIISNNLLTVGQSIKCFTVTKINPDSVVLDWEGKEYELTM